MDLTSIPATIPRIPIRDLEHKGEIAKGGQAKVDLYTHTPTGMAYAVKDFGRNLQPGVVECLRDEIVMLHSFRHPNVIACVAIIPDGAPFPRIVMEHAAKGTLYDVLRLVPPPPMAIASSGPFRLRVPSRTSTTRACCTVTSSPRTASSMHRMF